MLESHTLHYALSVNVAQRPREAEQSVRQLKSSIYSTHCVYQRATGSLRMIFPVSFPFSSRQLVLRVPDYHCEVVKGEGKADCSQFIRTHLSRCLPTPAIQIAKNEYNKFGVKTFKAIINFT